MNYKVGVGGQMSIQGSLMRFDDLPDQPDPDQKDDDNQKQAIRFELESQGTVQQEGRKNLQDKMNSQMITGLNSFIGEQTIAQDT